ncbi:MAG: M66 family metalloprotease [Nocardioides sp.]|uniref:M66 family metalloprotease n=1 Tax=Nocardioides sp. TaxID=35761 RepID=UPI003EFD23C8
MTPIPRERLRRACAPSVAALLCLSVLASPALPADAAEGPSTSATILPVSPDHLPSADIGFHDTTRTGAERPVRDDLTGALAGQVELVQATSVDPTGNAAAERPDITAERETLLLLTPRTPLSGVRVRVTVNGALQGTVALNHPRLLPRSDQGVDQRGEVAYSLKAWSVRLPWQWVRPGMKLRFVDDSGTVGTLRHVDVAAPKELVVNNIQLGMLTNAPDGDGHRFIKDPAWGATDYFSTIPVARLTMARYEKVELDRVIVASGAIYDAKNPAPGNGDVYSGDMRENVGKAQVSTGINLATWGITSSPMNQSQPQVTNQRVIHHSAGLYANGRHSHGLSGGNGMATLYDSVGNELSHELGHSYGLGHFPGWDDSRTGDDRVRNASHHMDSGWGWIGFRQRMRSNLDTAAFGRNGSVNGVPLSENLAGKFNFNRDAMSGGWDTSNLSDYTHHTGYSLKRIQANLKSVTADTDYPSGYRDWDAATGAWVDATQLNPSFDRPRPERVGGSVFTLLGGYNPAKPEQSLLYPAFRSNYGVTFDLPQVDPTEVSATRRCWVQVDFAQKPTRYVEIAANDGVKQLNVNIAESDRPTGAQVACRQNGVTTALGAPITIATDLEPLAEPVVVGQESGYEALRTQEMKRLQPLLAAQADVANPSLSAASLVVLQGWSDDLSSLSRAARTVAERILGLASDATAVTAYLSERGSTFGNATNGNAATLLEFLTARGYTDSATSVLPTGQQVTVDGGKCLTLDQAADGSTTVRTTTSAAGCTGTSAESWWADQSGRIHPTDRPDLCLRVGTPVTATACRTGDTSQGWILEDDGHVVSATTPTLAMDLNRSTYRPGMYNRHTGSNQYWRTIPTSANALLGHLDSNGLAALFEARVATLAFAPAGKAGRAGWWVGRAALRPTATVLLTGETAPVQVLQDGTWVDVTKTVALPQGRSAVTLRATSPYGERTRLKRTVKVDTVKPTLSSRLTARTVTLKAADATSGVLRIQFRTSDTGTWKTYRAPLVRSTLSTVRVLQVRATDKAGNVSKVVRVSLR